MQRVSDKRLGERVNDVKYEVARANRILAELGLANQATVSLGHVSMRLPDDPSHFVVKGRGYALDALPRMRPDDMIVCDLDGMLVDGPKGATQCFEVKIHSCIYRDHPEVQSVVHAHPRFTVLASLSKYRLVPACQEGAALVREPLPVFPHFKLITADEDGVELSTRLGSSEAILLTGHGAVTTGSSTRESVANMFQLEEQARMNWAARCVEGADFQGIPEALLAEADEATPFWELPHLRVMMPGGRPTLGGSIAYYEDLLDKQLAAELG